MSELTPSSDGTSISLTAPFSFGKTDIVLTQGVTYNGEHLNKNIVVPFYVTNYSGICATPPKKLVTGKKAMAYSKIINTCDTELKGNIIFATYLDENKDTLSDVHIAPKSIINNSTTYVRGDISDSDNIFMMFWNNMLSPIIPCIK